MANPYPFEIIDGTGVERLAGQLDFTDAANQPVGPTGPTSVTGDLTVTDGLFTVTESGPGAAYVFAGVGGEPFLGLNNQGGGDDFIHCDDNVATRFEVNGSGRTAIRPNNDNSLELFDSSGNLAAKVITSGQLVLLSHAAPADGDLAAGDCALWFDQTNGAAALNIKAKQANGTVKTATIPVVT